MTELFPARLRRLCEASGLSVVEVARAAGLGDRILYLYLNGQRTPTIVTAVQLAKTLRVTTAELLGEDHELVVAARVAVEGLPPLDPADRVALAELLRPVGV